MGQRDQAVVRIGRVVEEHRLARDVRQQHARGNHHEIRLAEGQVAVVVQEAQRQAGRGLGHRHDRAHAAIDRDRPAVGLLHQVAEDLVQEEGSSRRTGAWSPA